MQVLAKCPSSHQAEFLAAQLTAGPPAFPQPQDPLEMFGEERHVIRVLPIGGEWHVQSWPVSALEWEAKDTADVPWSDSDLQGEPDVSFP